MIADTEDLTENQLDITNQIFIIDSDNLGKVQDKLYGFVLNKNLQISDSISDVNSAYDGIYTYVCKDHNKIYIKQDYKGSWGLYLYRDKDYFAISNSFICLVDYVKKDRNISFNLDYANSFIRFPMCIFAYRETIINEIECIDRNADIEIDSVTKELKIILNNDEEHSVELCSKEGIEILDNWHSKWVQIIRKLYEDNKKICFDLSGGFDSRLILALFLNSGINLNNVRINSVDDKLHSHEEDYIIASKIAHRFGFKLNTSEHALKEITDFTKPLNIYEGEEEIPLGSIIKNNFFTKLGINKEMYWHYKREKEKIYYFPGADGEALRTYFHQPYKKYIQDLNRKRWDKYSTTKAVNNSVEKIITSSCEAVIEKYKNFGFIIPENEVLHYLIKESWLRFHYGKSLASAMFSNIYSLPPLMDKEICKLKLCDNKINDYNLLIALIFTRYAPELLEIEFDHNKIINPETIDYAREINSKFPYKKDLYVDTKNETEILKTDKKIINKTYTPKRVNQLILASFYSPKNKKLLKKYFKEDVYDSAIEYMREHTYQSLSQVYAIIAICKILNDISKNKSNIEDYMLNPKISVFNKITAEFFYDFHKIMNKIKKFIRTMLHI